MKSIHWLLTFICIWGSSAAASILTDKPTIMLAPAVVSVVIITALGLNNKMHDS